MISNKVIACQGRLRRVGAPLQQKVLTGVLMVFLSLTVQAELPEQEKNRLRHMIRHDCGSCHGFNLDGGLGPPLTADALKGKSDEILFNAIMYGVKDTPMPPWDSILDEEEVSWIVDQLKSGLPDE